mgnify:CR=1 FL=1
MKHPHYPLGRQRAPSPPSRGLLRSLSDRTLPRLPGSRRYDTENGCLFVSSRIADSDHPAVLAAFAEHACHGYGDAITLDGSPFSESSFTATAGDVRLVTSHERRESYAYYDWEEKP